MHSLLIYNIGKLLQVRSASCHRVCGSHMSELPEIQHAFLQIENGRIQDFGEMKDCPPRSASSLDAKGGYVFPGYVDVHTHLVFPASREQEMVMKIQGKTYAEIAKAGGGILNTAKKLSETSAETLLDLAQARLKEVIKTGTVAIEIKSGYGLSVRDELRMLRIIQQLKEKNNVPIRATFLGAHAVPIGMDKEAYIRLIIDEMLPNIATEKIADYMDVFCEQGFFDTRDAERLLEAGKKYGLHPRLHANQLANSGGVQVGVKVQAKSVDHLENIGEAEIEALKQSSVMPVALPAAAFFLNLPYTPARKIIEAGLPVTIASDYNPGSAPSGNMHWIFSLACIKMRMTPEEVLNAATLNAASTLDWHESLGSITKGKIGSVCVTKPIPSLAYIPYRCGENLLQHTIIAGKIV